MNSAFGVQEGTNIACCYECYVTAYAVADSISNSIYYIIQTNYINWNMDTYPITAITIKYMGAG